MLRTFAAIIAGQLTIAILNGIFRLATGFYLDAGMSLTGVSHLPSLGWKAIIVSLSFIYGVIAGLVICRIAKSDYKIEILCLALIIAATGLFDFYYLGMEEPTWYFLVNTGLIIAGLFFGYGLKLRRNKNMKTEHE